MSVEEGMVNEEQGTQTEDSTSSSSTTTGTTAIYKPYLVERSDGSYDFHNPSLSTRPIRLTVVISDELKGSLSSSHHHKSGGIHFTVSSDPPPPSSSEFSGGSRESYDYVREILAQRHPVIPAPAVEVSHLEIPPPISMASASPEPESISSIPSVHPPYDAFRRHSAFSDQLLTPYEEDFQPLSFDSSSSTTGSGTPGSSFWTLTSSEEDSSEASTMSVELAFRRVHTPGCRHQDTSPGEVTDESDMGSGDLPMELSSTELCVCSHAREPSDPRAITPKVPEADLEVVQDDKNAAEPVFRSEDPVKDYRSTMGTNGLEVNWRNMLAPLSPMIAVSIPGEQRSQNITSTSSDEEEESTEQSEKGKDKRNPIVSDRFQNPVVSDDDGSYTSSEDSVKGLLRKMERVEEQQRRSTSPPPRESGLIVRKGGEEGPELNITALLSPLLPRDLVPVVNQRAPRRGSGHSSVISFDESEENSSDHPSDFMVRSSISDLDDLDAWPLDDERLDFRIAAAPYWRGVHDVIPEVPEEEESEAGSESSSEPDIPALSPPKREKTASDDAPPKPERLSFTTTLPKNRPPRAEISPARASPAADRPSFFRRVLEKKLSRSPPKKLPKSEEEPSKLPRHLPLRWTKSDAEVAQPRPPGLPRQQSLPTELPAQLPPDSWLIEHETGFDVSESMSVDSAYIDTGSSMTVSSVSNAPFYSGLPSMLLGERWYRSVQQLPSSDQGLNEEMSAAPRDIGGLTTIRPISMYRKARPFSILRSSSAGLIEYETTLDRHNSGYIPSIRGGSLGRYDDEDERFAAWGRAYMEYETSFDIFTLPRDPAIPRQARTDQNQGVTPRLWYISSPRKRRSGRSFTATKSYDNLPEVQALDHHRTGLRHDATVQTVSSSSREELSEGGKMKSRKLRSFRRSLLRFTSPEKSVDDLRRIGGLGSSRGSDLDRRDSGDSVNMGKRRMYRSEGDLGRANYLVRYNSVESVV